MGTYGYCRISTPKQSMERQVRNIQAAYPDAVMVLEEYTGTTMDRREWCKLEATARTGDIIVFDSVSRMSRTADEGFAVYQELYNRGVELVFLKEPHINTETYRKALDTGIPLTGTDVDYILEGINKYFMTLAREQIRLAFAQAEKEVQDLHKRTSEGMETARLNGKQIGQRQGTRLSTRKAADMKPVIRQHSRDFGGSLTDVEVMKLTGLARNTYYKYKAEIKGEG